MFDPGRIKALTFDVFGTVVDWRESIIREGHALGRAKHLDVDWAKFADAWRGLYQPAMDRVRRGEAEWTKLDDLHRMSLVQLLGISASPVSPRPRSTTSIAPGIGSIRGRTPSPASRG